MKIHLLDANIEIEFKNRKSMLMDHVIWIDDLYEYGGENYIQVTNFQINPVTSKEFKTQYIILRKNISNIKVKLL